jgi:hypothetical protein
MHASPKASVQDNKHGTCSFRARAIARLECYASCNAFRHAAGLVTLLLLLMSDSVLAQVSHPRIWLDSATLKRLNALVVAKDPTWLAVKADADTYLRYSVAPYRTCAAKQICYEYEGFGWLGPVEELSLAYKLTGNTAYSNQVKAVLNVFAAAGSAPCQVDSGYASRTAVLALALGYDWIYDQLSSTDKANYTGVLDSCWTWVQANGYQWAAGGQPYGNYFGGHMLGYGLAALAVEGDDSNSASMQTTILNNFNNYVVPAFSTGAFQGGYAIESYNYGGNHFLRLFQYMKAMQTAGKTNLFTTYLSWLKAVANNTTYELRPDLWAVTDEGDWTGDVVRVLYQTFPYDLAGLLDGTTEGGWMQYMFNHLNTSASLTSYSYWAVNQFDSFFYNVGQTAVNYTATQPTYLYSPGDQHTIIRTDWTTSAVHTTFTSDVQNWADHQSHLAGHVSIQRGSDYLLVNAGMWNGSNGVSGSPSAADLYPNWQRNTLYYYDGGTNCLLTSGTQYSGCQMFWGTSNASSVLHKEASDWAYHKANLRPSYLNNNAQTTITAYYRSFVNINDIDFVFDRISAPSTSTRQLYWHTPALSSATPPGNARAISLNGAVGSATVGSSKIWIDTLLPASPTITQATGLNGWGSSTLVGTQEFIVSDPNASSCSTNCLFLTVLAPTASSVASMPTTSLISAGNFKGALYNDGVLPRVALFSADGTSQTKITYTVIYSSGLSGRHVIVDLVPGAYTVSKDGTIVLTGQAVGSDGSLSFVTTGGTTYSIIRTGDLAGPLPPIALTATVY